MEIESLTSAKGLCLELYLNPCIFTPGLSPICRFKSGQLPTLHFTKSTSPVSTYQKAMPADDYTAAVSGGLKLKSLNSSSKVSKSHKKRRPKPAQPGSSADASAEKSNDGAIDDGEDVKEERDDATMDQSEPAPKDGEAISLPRAGKTDAELRHEERRRKRVRLYSHVALYHPALSTGVFG